MKLTVAICTWNRAQLLDQTLRRMHDLIIPPGVEWELLVVNNNCTDHTDDVVASHVERLPLRHVVECKQGQSHSRNCAVAAATGEYLVWTDDDVLVDDSWLAEYVAAFRRSPQAAIFGGPVYPWFECTPPRWLKSVWERVAHAYAIRDFGEDQVALSPSVLPFGANYAVRIDEQRRFPYDPELGRKKHGALRGEEVTVILQMLAAGVIGRWVPSAHLLHYIPRDRQTARYLREFYHGQGQFQAMTSTKDMSPKLWGAPRWLWRQALQAEISYRVQRVACNPAVWIESLITSSTLWGQVRGSRSGRL
jgi:glycosyltransferase involved in cell wall biosynthesis